ncbi:MAG: adenosylmethionine--8-amino-7-oxononanoate transaminase [Rhodospirillaceae bacterium]|jgi:adenosylmethionine-8-amino-7-oxononanoate aminotransferase|nr:adenosylmethionine--8-amino-7-oxononanoate transaminase [Rhodospirillaceae bacterium]
MNDTILSLDRKYVWHPFTQEQTSPPPIVAIGGEFAKIFTQDGRELVDMISSWWVNLHGHCNKVIANAIAKQASILEQVIFADFTHQPAVMLATKLAHLLPKDLSRVFYSDNGSTAVEVALKIALQYFSNSGDYSRNHLIAFDGGYHGDTVGAMSLGKSSGYFRAWENLLFSVEMVPYPATWINDDAIAEKEEASLVALSKALDVNKVAAVIIEPLIQGAGGMRMCRPEFLKNVAKLVHDAGALLVFDEVMTGFGRTGALFACLKSAVVPDIICLSKGLTGGFLPMGATVIKESIYQAFLGDNLHHAFLHGHSYTANPLGCVAGLASLDLLLSKDCQFRISNIETICRNRIKALLDSRKILNLRLTGTVVAFDLRDNITAERFRKMFLDNGFLIRPLGSVIYFIPPYCIDQYDLNRAWDILEEILGLRNCI